MGSSKASCPSSQAPGNPVNVSTLCAALKHRMWTKLHNGMSGAGRDPLKQETDLSIICSIGGKTIIQSGMVCVAGRVGLAAGWAKFSPPRNPQLTAAGLCWPGVCNAVLAHVRSSTDWQCAKQWLQFAPPAQCEVSFMHCGHTSHTVNT